MTGLLLRNTVTQNFKFLFSDSDELDPHVWWPRWKLTWRPLLFCWTDNRGKVWWQGMFWKNSRKCRRVSSQICRLEQITWVLVAVEVIKQNSNPWRKCYSFYFYKVAYYAYTISANYESVCEDAECKNISSHNVGVDMNFSRSINNTNWLMQLPTKYFQNFLTILLKWW